jgi:hypothetical protein
MAWSTPLTAVANTTLTSSQWNASVRDNLNETAPAKATTQGRLIVTTGANSIIERAVASDDVATSQGTASTTFTNLATSGPAVTVTTGVNAIAIITARASGSTNGAFVGVGVTVSGASSIGAIDADAMLFQPATAASSAIRASTVVHFPGTLTAGSNTFTMQYRASAGTGTFQDRKITVIGL